MSDRSYALKLHSPDHTGWQYVFVDRQDGDYDLYVYGWDPDLCAFVCDTGCCLEPSDYVKFLAELHASGYKAYACYAPEGVYGPSPANVPSLPGKVVNRVPLEV